MKAPENEFALIGVIRVRPFFLSVFIRVHPPWLKLFFMSFASRVVQTENMKSAYELAMERLNKTAPTVKLTAAKKAELAEVDSQYAAKIAAREIALKAEANKFTAAGDFDQAEAARQQLASERKKLQSDLEDKKESIRTAK
jgi:hypothetical protein